MGLFGLVLLVGGGLSEVARPLVQLGLPLLLIAGVLAWRIHRWRRAETERTGPSWARVARRMWRPRGSSFYALLAALTFLGLQGEMLFGRGREAWETWRAAPYTDGGAFVDFLSGQLWTGVGEVVVAVSLESVLNAVWAGLWPVFWMQRYGLVVALGAILFAYATYRAARARVPRFDAIMHHFDGAGDGTQAHGARPPRTDAANQEDILRKPGSSRR